MENTFYNSFDLERLDASVGSSPEEYRNPFQVDRDRVIFSFAFRRLQSKTQVFQSGEYDFYRTRLTHSIEVAKLGRSICDFLRRHQDDLFGDACFVDPSLTEAICLAHDLGHPPFGHIGERKLNSLMTPYGGFEGNAQTVRILSRLIYKRPDEPIGMSPTRALLDGVMKYKRLWSEACEASGEYPDHHFLYDSQEAVREQVLDSATRDRRTDLNGWKSIECQIMDWADDTAYSLNDIADGIQASYITLESLRAWRNQAADLTRLEQAAYDDLVDSIENASYERRLGYKLGQFVQAVRVVERDPPSVPATRRHHYDLAVDSAIREACALYKRIAVELIFRSPQIQQVEFKGSYILERMFEALMHHYAGKAARPLGILPGETARLVNRESREAGKARRICDFLAGLTDGEAIRIYRRLFDADFGSITDLT